ncbi:MAG: hypothetical protein ACRD0K_05650 [Egibacteraceae bacterium]
MTLPRLLLTLVLGLSLLGRASPAQAAQIGFKAQPYGGFDATSGGPITGEKPESKLWQHDGAWWAAMIVPSQNGAHTIHHLEGTSWVDTGVVIDALPSSKEDVLSLGDTLYVTSRNSWTLNRFTYASGAYQKDAGFPVALPVTIAETLTIARDSNGVLWITWEQSGQVMVARSDGSDTAFSAPFVLPTSGADDLNTDDISSVISFWDNNGPAIGVMWSNQTDQKQYFAVHRDGAPDSAWSEETALSGPNEADDHLNLKTTGGSVFAVTKTGVSDVTLPIIRLLVRSPGGDWSTFPVALYSDSMSLRNTRPITELLIDAANRDIYVFMARGEGSAVGGIEYKRSKLDRIAFSDTATPFIIGGNGEPINDATSAKQVSDSQTGIVVMASDGTHYWWNRLGGDPSGSATPATPNCPRPPRGCTS